MTRPLSIYIIAGEASGDLLGGRLMQRLKERTLGNVRFYGVGGERMIAEGLSSLFPYTLLSLMGFVEILPYALKLLARVNSVVEDILAKQPDIVITIDSPGFNFRVIKKLRERGIAKGGTMKCVHYVAPTVWAYKPERAAKTSALFDHLMVILPFEPPYFEREGLPTTFVGHSIVESLQPGDAARFRSAYNIPEQAMLISMLPGSRVGELRRHMPIFAKAVTMLAQHYPMALAVPTRPSMAEYVTRFFQSCPFPTVIITDEHLQRDAYAASALALSKSGTGALELTLTGVPAVVTHKVNALSACWLRRLIRTRYYHLVNVLQQREIVPELMQEFCTPELLANALFALLRDTPRRNDQYEAGLRAASMLALPTGQPPSDRAAEIILSLAGSSSN